MKKKLIWIITFICIFIIISGLYVKKSSEVKERDNYISRNVYYALLDLDQVLYTFNNMDDSSSESIEKKNKYYSDVISRRLIALQSIHYLERDDDRYTIISKLGFYGLTLLDAENSDKDKLGRVVKALSIFNSDIKGYMYSDTDPFIHELIDSKSKLNESFMKVINEIE